MVLVCSYNCDIYTVQGEVWIKVCGFVDAILVQKRSDSEQGRTEILYIK